MLRLSFELKQFIQGNIDQAILNQLKFEDFQARFLSGSGLDSKVDIDTSIVRHIIYLPLLSPGMLTRASIVVAPFPQRKSYLVKFRGDLQLLLILQPNMGELTDVEYKLLASVYNKIHELKEYRSVAIPLRGVFGEPRTEITWYREVPYQVELKLIDGIGNTTGVLDETSEILSGEILFILRRRKGVICCGLLELM